MASEIPTTKEEDPDSEEEKDEDKEREANWKQLWLANHRKKTDSDSDDSDDDDEGTATTPTKDYKSRKQQEWEDMQWAGGPPTRTLDVYLPSLHWFQKWKHKRDKKGRLKPLHSIVEESDD